MQSLSYLDYSRVIEKTGEQEIAIEGIVNRFVKKLCASLNGLKAIKTLGEPPLPVRLNLYRLPMVKVLSFNLDSIRNLGFSLVFALTVKVFIYVPYNAA